jgi:riboflavin synthase
MFTGLIQAIGTVQHVEWLNAGVLVGIQTPVDIFNQLKLGDSIALNGCCTTVIRLESDTVFCVELSAETLEKTTFDTIAVGKLLNLELPITPTTPLGGHYVTGHIDCVLPLITKEAVGISWVLTFQLPTQKAFQGLLVDKGSIAIEGISLTVNTVTASDFSVCIIPHTMSHTTLGALQINELVQVEFDILGKYVQRLLQVQAS